MNINQILYFLQIYRDESFTKAAANLAITQPALSLQIKNLEKELGFALLERDSVRIQVTEKGKSFLTYAVDILDSFNNLENALKTHGIPEQLNIAAGGAICGWVLPGVIAELRKTSQNLRVQLMEGDRNFVRQALVTGRADFSISTEKIHDPRVESLYFCSDRIVPVISRNVKGPSSIRALEQFPFLFFQSGSSIQQIVDEKLHRLGLSGKLNIIMEIQSLISLIKSVEAGLGIGFISELAIPQTLKRLPLEPLYCPRKFYIYYRKKRKSALEEIASQMAQIAQQLPNILKSNL